MPQLYDWQKSQTLREAFEIYDWEKRLEQPSSRLRETAEDYRSGARRMAAVTGFFLGNNLAGGATLGRGLTSVMIWAGIAVYNNERSAGFQREAEELWPDARQQG